MSALEVSRAMGDNDTTEKTFGDDNVNQHNHIDMESTGYPLTMNPEGSPTKDRQNTNLTHTDFRLLSTLSQFNREKIPERAVHAKGAGAYGEFEVCQWQRLSHCRCHHIV